MPECHPTDEREAKRQRYGASPQPTANFDVSASTIVMTQLLSKSLRAHVSSNGASHVETFTCEDEAAFRRAYLHHVNLPDARDQLVHMASKLRQEADGGSKNCHGADVVPRSKLGEFAVKSWSVQANEHPNRLHTFDDQDLAVCIGKQGMGNEIELASAPGLSRVHAIILNVGSYLVVCDVGSLHGFRISARSGESISDQHEDESKPGKRRPLIVAFGETAVLQLGPPHAGISVVVNPKKCVICLENARDSIFNCGHFVCCRACVFQLRRAPFCPLCRSPITDTRVAYEAATAPGRACGI